MTIRTRIVTAIISAALYITFENQNLSDQDGLMEIADDIRQFLLEYYPLRDEESEAVMQAVAQNMNQILQGEIL